MQKRNFAAHTNRRPKHRLLWALLGALAVVLAVAVGGAIWLYQSFQPPAKTNSVVEVDVEKGQTVASVATELEQRGLVKNALVFRLYLRYRGGASAFQAGKYHLAKGTGIPEIVSMLSNGKVVNSAVAVTVPEGYTVVQIADRLDAAQICSKQDFLREAQSGSFSQPFLRDIGSNAHVKYRLEGYLFPDTYQFERGEPAHDVINEMLNDFASHVDANMQHDMTKQGLTLNALVTEASLVEKEARVNSERPIIASVIQNRLKQSMKLQIDATIEYILGHRDVLLDKDLTVDNPYNTYKNAGLPPGPIASPGLASMQAILHPASTKYLYYVVKNNGSGEHFFAVTYSEQLHNEALSRQNLKSHSH